ncbi:MAG: transcriptional repressor [Saprospiraceae bacterium]
MDANITAILKKHNLRRTGMREEVLRIFLSVGNEAIAHPELERLLPDADRITLYRTLKSFEDKGILHQVVDNNSATRYALCHGNCTEHDHHDEHAHFHCQDCGKTLCLDIPPIGQVQVPDGFRLTHAHIILEGVCDRCVAV